MKNLNDNLKIILKVKLPNKEAADNQTLVKMLNRNVRRARRGKRII